MCGAPSATGAAAHPDRSRPAYRNVPGFGARAAKTHLGSGNVLMSPNDEYLWMVEAGDAHQRKSEKVQLPFEGDRMLSLILSKALLLASDDEIRDPLLTHPLRR